MSRHTAELSQNRLSKQIAVNGLQLAGMSCFALAQPVYSLIARYPEFLIAHRAAGPLEIGILILILALAVPMLLIGVEFAAALAGRHALQWMHRVLLTVLALVIVLVPLNRVRLLGAGGALAIAGLCAVIFALLYGRARWLRSFVTVTAFGVLIFPLHFAVFSPVGKLITLPAQLAKAEIQIQHKPPIVMIVFDEFPLRLLLNDKREIDAVRFPNFAAFSRRANWYRNATTVSTDTRFAVPAILTGREPTRNRLPIMMDYPQNLFTLLDGQYDLKVQEAITALCPVIAPANARNLGLFAGLRSILRDVAVLYGYLLLPRNYWSLLPTIKNGWAGFGGDPRISPDESKFSGGDELPGVSVQQFIESIKPDEKPTLHYLHVLLPHTPYVYLPTGQYYTDDWKDTEGLGDDKVWTGNQALVQTAEQRCLLQVGFTDWVVGQVIERLKQAGIYDQALIVLAADHGVAFEPGHSYRDSIGNDPGVVDLLPVPLFIKPPKQQVGKTIDTFASTVDILPTITRILGFQLPWEHDGNSLLDSPPQEPRPIHIYEFHKDTNGVKQTFQWKEVIGFSHLDRQIQRFGQSKSLDDLTLRGRHYELLGKPVGAFTVRVDRVLKIQHDQAILWDKPLDPRAQFLPLYQSGRILNGGAGKQSSLAIAINGVIGAVVQTYPDNANEEFRAILPRASVKAGKNSIQFFVVGSGSANAQELISPLVAEPYKLRAGADGGHELILGEGTVIRIEPGALRGVLEPLELNAESLVMKGWAIDEQNHCPAREILFFADGRFVAQADIQGERQDLVGWLGEDLLKCGYYEIIPTEIFRNTEISAYALSNGKASELKYSNPEPNESNKYGKTRYFCGSSSNVGGKKAETQPSPSSSSSTEKSLNHLLKQKEDGRMVLVTPDGGEMPITTGTLQGAVEPPDVATGMVSLRGWAVDPKAGRPAEEVLVFVDGRCVSRLPIADERPDLADWLGKQYLKSGFTVILPANGLAGEICVIGICGNNASELQYASLSNSGKIETTSKRFRLARTPS